MCLIWVVIEKKSMKNTLDILKCRKMSTQVIFKDFNDIENDPQEKKYDEGYLIHFCNVVMWFVILYNIKYYRQNIMLLINYSRYLFTYYKFIKKVCIFILRGCRR